MTLLSVPGKVFAQIILDRGRHHLLEHQRPEQSGFTPKRSTIDRILALRVLTERRRDFWQGLLAAYVDLCKAFDSVNRDALWRIRDLRETILLYLKHLARGAPFKFVFTLISSKYG